MKSKKIYFVLPVMAFMFSWIMPSCSNGDEDVSVLPEDSGTPSRDPLVNGVDQNVCETSLAAFLFDNSVSKAAGERIVEGDTLFSGKHIEAFNPKSGRLYFRNMDVTSLYKGYQKGADQVVFALDSVVLFTARFVTASSSISVMDLSLCYTPDSIYLQDAYPAQYADNELALQCKAARETEWQRFIEYLQKTGKLLPVTGEDNPPILEPGNGNNPQPNDTTTVIGPEEPTQNPGSENDPQPNDTTDVITAA